MMQKYDKKIKVMVISFDPLRHDNANGRTIINLVGDNDSIELAQLYFSPHLPDYDKCSYFRITDDDIVKSLLFNKPGQIVSAKDKNVSNMSSLYKNVKAKRNNQFLRYVRQKVWGIGTWKTKNLCLWVDSINPDIILLFSGNNAFIDKIAWFISKYSNAPMVLYNCEDYYLKDPKYNTLFSKINKRFCDRVFKKTMAKVKGIIYLTEYLRNAYDDEFEASNSISIMNCCSDYFLTNEMQQKNDQVVYLGNVNIGREKSLCKVADCLGKIGKKLNIYGNIQDEQIEEMLTKNKNITLHEPVSYYECCRIMQESMLIIHCESFEERHLRDIKYAFSTKIPDCLACGTPLFVFAPDTISLVDYLLSNKCAFVSLNNDDLTEILQMALFNNDMRKAIVEKAKEMCKKNHNHEKNRVKINVFLNEIAKGCL